MTLWIVMVGCTTAPPPPIEPVPIVQEVEPADFVVPYELTALTLDTGADEPPLTGPQGPREGSGVQWEGVGTMKRKSNSPFRGIPSWKTR